MMSAAETPTQQPTESSQPEEKKRNSRLVQVDYNNDPSNNERPEVNTVETLNAELF